LTAVQTPALAEDQSRYRRRSVLARQTDKEYMIAGHARAELITALLD
jgi:hypothetical protein